MNKAVALLAFTALIAGCQSILLPSGLDNKVSPGLRCFGYWGHESTNALEAAYIQELSKSGDSLCRSILGSLYENGHGVPQDIPKAKAIYQSLADADPRAYGELGRMAEKGIGGPPNLVEARQFYQRAVAKPGAPDNEVKLAEFMEYGIGGPQDFQGALKHYLNSAGVIDSASWEGVARMRAKGLPLTTEQQQRYNYVFASRVQDGVRKKSEAIKETLAAEHTPVPASKRVQVQLVYTPGSVVPAISLLESSGNRAIDQKVMQGFSDYRFPADPIMPPSQKTYKAIGTLNGELK
ncbi:sel1 repeat family protein [Pseudomonas sp. 31-12]|nr:sel1 repeat family protein [Pseudomonas sp. 31-12]